MISWSSSASPISRPAPRRRRRSRGRARRRTPGAAGRGRAAAQGRVVAQPRLADQPQQLAAGLGGDRRGRRRGAATACRTGRRPSAVIHQLPFIPRWLWSDDARRRSGRAGACRTPRRCSSVRPCELGGAVVKRRARVRGVGERDLACRRARRSSARAARWIVSPSGTRSARRDQLARLAREAGGDDLLLEPGAEHRLAVDALDPELRDHASRAPPRRGARSPRPAASPSSSTRRTMPLPPRST